MTNQFCSSFHFTRRFFYFGTNYQTIPAVLVLDMLDWDNAIPALPASVSIVFVVPRQAVIRCPIYGCRSAVIVLYRKILKRCILMEAAMETVNLSLYPRSVALRVSHMN